MEEGAIIKHNQKKAPKTGDWSYVCPEVDKSKCIGCGQCAPFCPEACIEINPVKYFSSTKNNFAKQNLLSRVKDKKAEIDMEYCKGCGVCAEVCPVKAILMKKK